METENRDYPNISGRRCGYDRRVFANPNYRSLEKRVTAERRKGPQKRTDKRYRVKDLTFVKLRSESEIEIGQLLDISKEGLAFRHFIDNKKSRKYHDLGLFLSGGGFSIDRIPFKAVSSIELANNSQFSTIILKRYGVQFEKLTPDQTKRLDHFLLNYTLGEA